MLSSFLLDFFIQTMRSTWFKVSAKLCMLSENKLQDQDIKNQINFKIVIIVFHIIADNTAKVQELIEVQSTDIYLVRKVKNKRSAGLLVSSIVIILFFQVIILLYKAILILLLQIHM